jgi:hypothetical protein
MTSLSVQLQKIGLRAVPAHLDDFLARAAKARWSPQVLLEQVAQAETDERSRRSLERRLLRPNASSLERREVFAKRKWPAHGRCREPAAVSPVFQPATCGPHRSDPHRSDRRQSCATRRRRSCVRYCC